MRRRKTKTSARSASGSSVLLVLDQPDDSTSATDMVGGRGRLFTLRGTSPLAVLPSLAR